MKIGDIIDDLKRLQHDYAFTRRAMVTEERYKGLIESGMIKNFTYDSEFIREPLIEHVGNLPIIASFLHQYIENTDKVDLGRVLIMLSVHDIGETVVGDMFTFDKTLSHAESEIESARRLLPEYLFAYFEEIEACETLDAKFAKAVDSMAPWIHEMALPMVTHDRFKHHDFDVAKIISKKKMYFDWDSVLLQMFDYIMDVYRDMEK
jgi:putative hydrolase of HD superfamily